jgi:DNA-binding protein
LFWLPLLLGLLDVVIEMVHRITQSGKTRNYINYFEGEFAKGSSTEVSLLAAGRAAPKAIMVAEILKTKFRLSQTTSLSLVDGKSVLSIVLTLDRSMSSAIEDK